MIDATAATYAARRRRVLQAARQASETRFDALLVSKQADITYLCGSTEGAGPLLFSGGWCVLFTGNMFRVRATREAPGVEICIPEKGTYAAASTMLRRRRKHRIGIQESVLTVTQHRALAAALAEFDLADLGGAVGECRAIKDAGETERIRRAAEIADEAFRQLVSRGRDYFLGKTENQLAGELEYLMRGQGSEGPAFSTIVASGPNSFNCHHIPGSRTVEAGDPVLFDWGAVVGGYRSDLTRVVFAGPPSATMREIYDVVLRAHDAAVERMKPGVALHTIDAAARSVIGAAGYAKEFRHGLGHGVGLEVHEGPGFGGRPATGRGKCLKRGMVITVEPGVYLEGVGGVRIEDDILLTAGGCERLSSLSRDVAGAILV